MSLPDMHKEEDYKQKYSEYQRLVETADSYKTLISTLDDLSRTIQRSTEPKGLSPEAEEALFGTYCPSIIGTLLDRRAENDDVCVRIMKVLCCWMVARLPALGKKLEVDTRVLNKIFSFNGKYYNSNHLSLTVASIKDAVAHVAKLKLSYYEYYVNHDYVTIKSKLARFLVEVFGTLGGFEFLANGISNATGSAEHLALIKCWLKIMVRSLEYLVKSLHNGVCKPICRAVKEYLLRLTAEELLAAKDADLKKIMARTKKLFESCSHDYGTDPISDFEFDMAMKYLSVSSSEKRAEAAALILQRVRSIKDKFPPKDGYFYKEDYDAYKLGKKLEKEKFVDQVFDIRTIHAEAIKKCPTILELLYCWKFLTNTTVNKIWAQALDATTVSVQSSIIQTLESVALHFADLDAKEFFDLFRLFPLDKYNEAFARLLIVLVRNEYHRNRKKGLLDDGEGASGSKANKKNKKEPEPVFILENREDVRDSLLPGEVLEFAWNLLIRSNLPPAAQNVAIEGLSTVVPELYPHKLSEYLHQAEHNVAEGISFAVSSRLFAKFATALLQKSPKAPVVSIPGLLEKVTVNIILFKKSAAEKMVARIASGKQMNGHTGTVPMDTGEDLYESLRVNENGQGYYAELEERLELVKFLLKTCRDTVPKDYIEVLWKAFALNNFSAKEVDIFFRFMKALVHTSRSVELISDNAFDSFLFEVLLKLPENEYSEVMLDCLTGIIVPLNAKYGHIKILPDDKLELVDSKLIGFGHLWGIAFQAGSAEVRHKAAETLGNLYTHPAEELAVAERAKVAEEFVARCVESIRLADNVLRSVDLNNEDAQNRAMLALEILEKYLKPSQSETPLKPPPPKDFLITMKDFYGETKVKVNENMLLLDVLNLGLVQLKNNKKIETLEFVSPGLSIEPVAEPLSIFGIFSPVTIEVKESYSSSIYNTNYSYSQPKSSAPAAGSTDESFATHMEQLKNMFANEPSKLLEVALQRSGNSIDKATELMTGPMLGDLRVELGLVEEPSKVSASADNKKADLLCGENSKYFDAVYRLLELGNTTIQDKAWNILSALKLNEDFCRRVRSAYTAEDWDRLLKSASHYQLAYVLKALEQILHSPNDSDKGMWVENLIRSGGFWRLCDIPAQFPIAEASEGYSSAAAISGKWTIGMKCVETVLKLIREIIETTVALLKTERYAEYTAQKKELNRNCCKVLAKEQEPMLSPELARVISKEIAAVSLLHILSKTLTALMRVEMSATEAVHQGLHLLHLLPLLDPGCADSIFDPKSEYKRLAEAILFKGRNDTIKDQFVFEIQTLLKLGEGKTMRCGYLNLFLGFLRDPVAEFGGEHYFDVFDRLIEGYNDPEIASRTELKKEDLAAYLIKPLTRDWKASESAVSGLSGNARILSKLLQQDNVLAAMEKSDRDAFADCLLNEVFKPKTGPVRGRSCDSQEILSYVMPILARLAAGDSGLSSRIVDNIIIFNAQQKPLSANVSKGTAPANAARTTNSYVGLENFGCTCYINSLFQQLYMMPGLREKFLGLDTVELEKQKGEKVAINLKKVFAQLQDSERQYFAPKEFCDNFKFRYGKVVDVHVQEDVDEFFTHLTSKVEDELTAAKAVQIVNEELGMVLQNRIASLDKELHYSSDNENPLLAIPLNIKGCKSVHEALDAFFKEEILDGDNKYFCEEHRKKIKVSKRCTIKSLSNTVVISLKRFDSSLTKLNDYCEFPERLNFFKWSCDSRNDAFLASDPAVGKYEYQLVGVLIHSGTAQAGHYFSYIKERAPKSPNYGCWFEFNDTLVKPFDYGKIISHAFGGATSAYLLFYEKVKTEEAPKTAGRAKPVKVLLSDPDMDMKIYTSQEYGKLMRSCMETYRVESTVEGADMLPFVPRSLSTLCSSCLKLVGDIIDKNRDVDPIRHVLAGLRTHAASNLQVASAVAGYMTRKKRIMNSLLFKCSAKEVREETAQLLAATWCTMARQDPDMSVELAQLLTFDGLIEARRNSETYQQYFRCLELYCCASPKNAADLVNKEMIYELINLMADNFYSLRGYYHPQEARLSSIYADLAAPISALSTIVRSCATDVMKKLGRVPSSAIYPLEVMPVAPKKEIEYLYDRELKYMPLVKCSAKGLAEIIAYLGWENAELLNQFMEKTLKDLTYENDTTTFLGLLRTLIELSPRAMFQGLLDCKFKSYTSLTNYLRNEVGYSYNGNIVYTLLGWLFGLGEDIPTVAEVMKEHFDDFNSLAKALKPERYDYAYDTEKKNRLRSQLLKLLDVAEEKSPEVKKEKPAEEGLFAKLPLSQAPIIGAPIRKNHQILKNHPTIQPKQLACLRVRTVAFQWNCSKKTDSTKIESETSEPVSTSDTKVVYGFDVKSKAQCCISLGVRLCRDQKKEEGDNKKPESMDQSSSLQNMSQTGILIHRIHTSTQY